MFKELETRIHVNLIICVEKQLVFIQTQTNLSVLPVAGHDRDRMKSSMSTNTSSERGKANQSRHGISPTSATESNARKVQSAA